MGKFDREILKEQLAMSKPYISFQWDTGYVVMAQEHFNKLKSKQKKLLMAKALIVDTQPIKN